MTHEVPEANAQTELLRVWRRASRVAQKRTKRLIGRLTRDLDKAETSDQLRAGGEALKTQLHLVAPGQNHVVLEAPWLPDGRVEVALRRELSPKANLARIFRRARGFEAARARIEHRLLTAMEADEALTAVLAAFDLALERGDDVDPREVGGLVAQARRAGAKMAQVASPKSLAKSSNAGPKLPPGVRGFQTQRGGRLFAGKDARSNDQLVRRVARGRDIWLHVRDQPGSHVVLQMKRMEAAPDSRDLLDAAILCAHLSGVRKGDTVDVAWTRAKYVRKPKGGAAGLVLVTADKTIRVKVEAAVVDALYALQRRKTEDLAAKVVKSAALSRDQR